MFNYFAKTFCKLLLEEEFTFWGAKHSAPADDALIIPLAKGVGAMFYFVIVADMDALPREQFDTVFEAYLKQVPVLLEADFERVIFLTLFVTGDESFSVANPEFVPDQSFYNVQWIADLSEYKVKIPNNSPTNILKIRNIAEKALSVCSGKNLDTLNISFSEIATDVTKAKYSVSHKPIVTYAILIINFIIWGCMELFGGSTNSDTLIAFGASIYVLNPEWGFYRLFSSMFLHIGIVHLAYNSFSLYIFGARLEKFFGSYVFLLIYVLSGLTASFFSMFFYTVSAGASGAILGLAGALIVLGKKNKLTFHGLNTYTILLLSVSVIAMGFLDARVNNLAHIIGFGAGMLSAYIYHSINLYWQKQRDYQ